MNVLVQLFFLIFLFALELFYFKIADRYNIIDHPNHRSSHTKVTIRGGGVIFSISLLLAYFSFGALYPYFIVGLFLISLISFIDDIKTVTNRIRIICHFIAVALLFYQLGMYYLPLYWIVLVLLFAIGTINSINFMDGINGITGSYGLVTLLTLYYVDRYVITYINSAYLIISIISILVFSFFNFRKKAMCFAGDVGSISLAFIILFFLLQLIVKTNNLNYILLLVAYGLDIVTTIFFRLLRGENIFEAHRSHFYQFLVNERKRPHLYIATLYSIAQGIINIILINFLPVSLVTLLLLLFTTSVVFILIRLLIEGSHRLLGIK